MRDDVLHLARVLGGGMDEHVAVLAGHGEGDLPFQVEVLLAAQAELADQALRRALQLLLQFAALELVVVEHGGPGDDGVVDVDCRHGRGRGDACPPCRPPGLVAGLGDHDEQHLAVEHDLALGDERVVADALGADVVAAGDVGGGQHVDDAGRGAHRVEIERGDAAGGDGRIARCQMQRGGRQRHVVGVVGGAGDMLDGAVVGDRLADDGKLLLARRRFLGRSRRRRRGALGRNRFGAGRGVVSRRHGLPSRGAR